ncbi:hypothetical protein [Croceicoccus sp. BE223]|uniref:hypothetical protein n=1 Tax=Croceicoccus sp. BE223 TaxID=2817716 RepID=UPI00285ED7F6|nr:hypothetical protein [Croceicoccus sp. BE223]MDR7101718.1 hypothetical protein [Croceicoccus sp. BE223]
MATPVSRGLLRVLMIGLAATAMAPPALAQSRGWGQGPGAAGGPWMEPMMDGPRSAGRDVAPDPREGRVEVSRFVMADAGVLLDPGPMRIVSLPGGTDDAATRAVYEAALVDQLVRAGFDTLSPAPADGRVLEMRIVRDVLVPAEGKKRPVSGTATVGVSNRGSMMGMAVNVDLSDPKTALIGTRLELHLRAGADGPVLWEGHATLASRDRDDEWGEAAIASRLAAALFEGFPAHAELVPAPMR